MNGGSRMNVDQLISSSSQLIKSLNQNQDINIFNQSVALRSRCNADFEQAKCAIEDYRKKIDMCKQKIAEAKSKEASDEELDLLQTELDDELKSEHALREELRALTNDIDNLESQRVCIEECNHTLKKLEQADKRAEMKLSMYASVTRIIPNLEDKFSISGHIVEKDEKLVEKFEFDSSDMTDYDTCNSLWKMIDS